MRWLVLDEIVFIQKKNRALTRSRVPKGSFSSELLLMEMMAQTGGLLFGAENNFEEDIVFAKIEKADFFNPEPGEIIEIQASSQGLQSGGSWLDAVIQTPEGKKIAESHFFLIKVGKIEPGIRESIVFHKAFMKHFQVREKVKE